ncbi:ESPR-type extended signal peptide-containing protein [Acinetobacter nosocomialis]|uniref:ESPR-type extended signal peptide-containing protein n=1 Tax=Acinetobacter nosocomialis TaxID=106654 RepID=UPI00124D7DDF|nr:ESPR-type extended signal peptide-containing protein [Acinetobacter nosocomialis]
MNKIYKVIWNASLGIWVAVSEIAKGHSKTRSQRTNNALMPFTEATDFLQSSTSINFKIKPLTWGILTVLVPSITFGEVGVSGGFATGNNATAISACTGTGVGGTGDRATAGGERALAIGCGAVTDSDRDIAIGSQASTANPANATGTYNESIAIGAESRASGSQALAIGGQATATGNSSVAIGADDMDKVASTNPPAYNYTPTAGDNALYNNTATAAAYKNLTGDYLVDFEKTNGGASGIGNRYTRVQTGEAAVAVGPKATATDLGTALGAVATAGAPISVALGVKAEAQGQGSLSIGSLAYTKNTGDVAVGVNSAATGGDSIAIGAGSDLKGTAYVQSGASASKKGASASGANSISIGTNTAATGTNAVVVGTQSTASNLAVAVGSVATAGDQSVSIGSNSAASSQTSVAIGVRAQTLQTNSVALGSDSVADRASGSLGYDPLTETSTTNTNSTWKATDAAVSVGNGTTRTRQITSVAAGTNDTDAANVAQLKKATSKVLAGTGTTVAQGTDSNGITTYTVNANTFTVRQGTTNKATIGDSTTDKVSFINGKNTVAKVADELNSNTDVTFDLADDISLNSVTTGNTTLNSSGVTVNGGVNGPVKLTNTGLDNGGNKITNVAAGTVSSTSTDAVNGSQLNTTNQNVTTAQNTANTAVTNAAAAQNTANTAVTNAATAQATADKGLNFSVNGGTADNVKLGETVNFANGINTTAVYDSATNTYKYNVNDNIALTNAGSLTVGNTKVDNSGLTITGGPSVTTAGINAGNQKITNVAAGTLSSTSTDAVNGSQLNTTNQNVTNAQNTANTALTNAAAAQATADKGLNFSVNGGTTDNVKLGETVNFADGTNTTALYDPATNTYKYNVNDNIALTNAGSLTVGNTKVDNSGLTITGGPSVTTAGINAGNQKITNVAAGTISATSTDAVNGSQLDATNQNVTTAQNTANTAVTNAAAAQATADKGLNFSVNGGTADNVKLGETVNFADGTNTTAVYDPATNTYKYNVNDNIALTNAGSLTVGNTKVDNRGLSITGGPSVTTAGINAGNQKITNVAAGTNPTDAVNVSQLGAITTAANTKTDALGISTASNLGGGAVYNPVTGAVSSPIYSVNGNNVNNVGDAITALDKGWTLQSNGANATAVKAGDTVDIGTVAGESNLKVTKTGNKIQYGLNRDLNVDSVTAGNSKLDTTGLTIAGGPSVTKSGIDAASQKITNVAAGTVSATSTDAVNGSQLHTLDSRVTKNGDSIANIFGGGAKANPDGSITNPTYKVAGTSANNVGDALTALDKAVTDAGTAANAGWTVSANGDAATAKNIKPNGKVNFTGDDNLTVAQTSETYNEGNIKVTLNKNLKVDSVTTGTTVIDTTGVKVGDNIQLGSTGLIIAGGPSMTTSGINAGNKVITNVAAGVNTTDAVNKGQLDSAITNINNNVGALANSAVQYDKNADDTVNKDSVTFAGGANGTALKNVADGTVAASSKDVVNGGQLWNVQQQVDKNTGDISNLQTDISNINNGKSGLVQQANKDAAITVGKDTGGTQVNVAGTAGDRTVTGVKAGAVTATSKDAVNGSQLNTTNQALVNYLGGGAGYDNITQSFSNPTYNVGDKSYNNVGDAIGALNQADQTLNTKIDSVTNKLEQAFYSTNQRIDKLEEKMSAGIAANAALENAPFIPGKVTMAVGAAYYNEQNAVGVTLRKTADNGRWSLTTGASLGSQGSPLVRVGVSTVID